MCPQCNKGLVKFRKTINDHYDSFHKDIPNDRRHDAIKIVMKRGP